MICDTITSRFHLEINSGLLLSAVTVCRSRVSTARLPGLVPSCQYRDVTMATLCVSSMINISVFLKLLLFLVLFLCLCFLKAPVCRIQEDLLAEVEYDVDHFDFITV